jgi:hypothetical protein
MKFSADPALEVTFGGRGATLVMLYLQNYGSAHGSGVASTFELPVSVVQKQLQKFEAGGLLVSRMVGSTRLYEWNPRSQVAKSLRAFLQDYLDQLPRDQLEAYFRERRRPRRPGKRLA